MKLLEHTGAFATFPNLGQAVQPHAILEVRSPNGRLVWSFEHDGKKPEQVISKDVALEMIRTMGKVVQQGTRSARGARRDSGGGENSHDQPKTEALA